MTTGNIMLIQLLWLKKANWVDLELRRSLDQIRLIFLLDIKLFILCSLPSHASTTLIGSFYGSNNIITYLYLPINICNDTCTKILKNYTKLSGSNIVVLIFYGYMLALSLLVWISSVDMLRISVSLSDWHT